ncbi:MAG: cellulose binding domain-containing protein, partial [Chloroflexota bacterium]|nr:cellulose binding domain-containing protein [Chloroflexota bacterium]
PSVTPSAPPRPSTAAAPTAPPTSTASGDGIDVSWQLQSSWPTGYVAQLMVRAAGSGVDAWSVSWPDPHAAGIANTWGLTCAVNSGEIRCQGADWAEHIPAGGTVTVGLQVVTDGIAPASPTVTIGH